MDDSAVHRLPVEIWADVAITLRDTYPCIHGPSSIDGEPCPMGCDVHHYHSVRPLPQVCRYLYNAIQPILFEYISLDVTDGANTNKMNKLASALATRPDLRAVVHGFRLEGFEPQCLSDAFLQVLPLLVELRSLTLSSGTINSSIMQLLRNATHLHTLHMTSFQWGQDVPENWSSHEQFGRHLNSLILKDLSLNQPHHMAKCSRLLTSSLTSLRLKSDFIFRYMKTSPTLPFSRSLIEFSTFVHDGHQDAFINFISQCSNIERLEAPGTLRNLSLERDFLPKLRSIEGYSYLTKLLLPGRPIQSILIRPDFDFIAQPLPDMEVVHLRALAASYGGIEPLHAVLKNCPGLLRLEISRCKLSVQETIREWIQTRMVSDVAAVPRLQVLRIKSAFTLSHYPPPIEYPLSGEMVEQRELVARMKQEHCPDLYHVQLRPYYAWNYVRADNAWLPTVAARDLWA